MGDRKFFRFYSLWYEHRSRVKDLFLLRYEDMRADLHATFAGLGQFLGIPQQEPQLRQALSDANFENMKKVEQSGNGPKIPFVGLQHFWIRRQKKRGCVPRAPRQSGRIPRLFVRRRGTTLYSPDCSAVAGVFRLFVDLK